jgi:hypothetical protein
MLKKSLIMASVLVFASAAMCYAEDTAQKVTTPATTPAVTTQKASFFSIFNHTQCSSIFYRTCRIETFQLLQLKKLQNLKNLQEIQNSKNVKMLLKNV